MGNFHGFSEFLLASNRTLGFFIQLGIQIFSFCKPFIGILMTGICDILLQGSVWPLGFAMKSCSMLRNRMLADPSFLFKIGTEVC